MNKRFKNYIKSIGKTKPEQLSIDELLDYQSQIDRVRTLGYKINLEESEELFDKNQVKQLLIEAASSGRRFYCVRMIEDFIGYSDVPPFEPMYTQPYEIGIDDFD